MPYGKGRFSPAHNEDRTIRPTSPSQCMEHCTGIPTDEATKWLVSAAARDISANQPMSLNQEKQIVSLQGTRFEQADSVVVDDDIANYRVYNPWTFARSATMNPPPGATAL